MQQGDSSELQNEMGLGSLVSLLSSIDKKMDAITNIFNFNDVKNKKSDKSASASTFQKLNLRFVTIQKKSYQKLSEIGYFIRSISDFLLNNKPNKLDTNIVSNNQTTNQSIVNNKNINTTNLNTVNNKNINTTNLNTVNNKNINTTNQNINTTSTQKSINYKYEKIKNISSTENVNSENKKSNLFSIDKNVKNIYDYLINKNNDNINSTTTSNINLLVNDELLSKNGHQFFENIQNATNIDPKKFQNLLDFLTNFKTKLIDLNPVLTKSTSIVYLLSKFSKAFFGAIVGSIAKISIVIVGLGKAISFFITGIIRSLSSGTVKSYIMMKLLPNFFRQMGTSFLMLSLGIMALAFVQPKHLMLIVGLMVALIGLMGYFKSLGAAKSGKVRHSGGVIFNIMMIATGIGILVLSLHAIAEINWTPVFMLLAFIGTLNLIIIGSKFGMKKAGIRNSDLPIVQFAMGIGILTLAIYAINEIDSWSGPLKLLAFMSAVLAMFTVSKIFSKGGRSSAPENIHKFAFAIGILTLAMFAFAVLPVKVIATFTVFLGSMVFIMNQLKGSKRQITSIILFSVGLTIITGALVYLTTKNFDIDKALAFSIAVATVSLSMSLVSMLIKDKKSAINLLIVMTAISSSIVVSAYGLGLLGETKINIDKILAFSVGFAVVSFVLSGVSLLIKTKAQATQLLLVSITISSAIAISAYGLSFIGNSKLNLNKSLLFVGVFTLISGAIIALGFFISSGIGGVVLTAGIAGMLGIAGTSYLLAITFNKISKTVNVDKKKISNFIDSLKYTAIGLAKSLFYVIAAVPASIMLLPMVTTLLPTAKLFQMISGIEINTTTIDNFVGGIKLVATGLSSSFFDIVKATPAAVLLLPIAASLVVVAGLFKLISFIDLKEKLTGSVNNMMDSTNVIVDKLNDFGIVSLGKSALKAAMLLPIFATMHMGAMSMQEIQKVNLDKTQLEAFTTMTDTIITDIVTVVDRNQDKLESVGPGLENLTKILNVGNNIAQVVKNMASLTYDEYKVVNGKLVLKSRRKLEEKDFVAAGNNLGTIIKKLTEPLNELGKDSGTFMLGNFAITNPFKNNDKAKGVAFIEKLGNAYLPLTESLKNLSQSGIYDTAKIDVLIGNLTKTVGGYVGALHLASTINPKKAKTALTEINKLDSLFDSDYKNFDKITTSFITVVNAFSDDKKWKQIRSNLVFMKKEFVSIAKTLNSLDVEKMGAFERSIKIIAESNKAEVAELIEKLTEFIGALKEQNFGNNNINDDSDNGNTTFIPTKSVVDNTTPSTNTSISQPSTQQPPSNLNKLFEDMISGIGEIADKLDNTLDVRVQNGNTFGV